MILCLLRTFADLYWGHADERRLELNRVTEQVIGSAFKVGNTLGVGFLEQVYENALVHELRKT
ncbi:MAG: GxxExxY protein, partial [Sphaerospermopsis kisseleviana]